MNGEAVEYESLKQYSFIPKKVPRLQATDPEVDKLISNNLPVVVTGTNLVTTGLKWDLQYLEDNIGNGSNSVFMSETGKFKFYDESRTQSKDFHRPTEKVEVNFSQFREMLQNAEKEGKKLYLQQTLNSTVGKNMVADFVGFNWSWVNKYKQINAWGPLTTNLLLVGMEGNVTPAHYDEQQNFFTQLIGYKRVILFSPDQFKCLYPHPVSHPCDRQSQVDFDDPDIIRFPKFSEVQAYECVVGPGDVVYIPMYWWHHIESLKTTNTSKSPKVNVSVNFWYKAPPVPAHISQPITSQQKVAIMRNVEKMLIELLKNPEEVKDLLCTLTEGRFT